jgi:hypothetical protein
MPLTEQERAAIRERWRRGETECHRHLELTRGVWVALTRVARQFFAAESKGKAYPRRPQLSFALPLAGLPPGKLTIRPQLSLGPDKAHKYRLGTGVVAECVIGRVNDRPTVEAGLCCDTGVEGDFLRLFRMWLEFGTESLLRGVEAVRHFLTSPDDSFRGASDRCCICRHRLKDETSRSRGIGPCCHSRAVRLRQLVETAIAKEALTTTA